MQLKKNINLGKNNLLLISLILSLFFSVTKSETINDEKFVEIKILDKVSSKNSKLEIEIGKETKYKNLLIKEMLNLNSKLIDDKYEQVCQHGPH